MNSEEHRPEAREPAGEPVEGSQGFPADPASGPEGLSREDSSQEDSPQEDSPQEDSLQVGEDPGVVGSEESEVPEDGEPPALRAELEAAQRERDDYLDALRRLKAEFENARKRQQRERARLLEIASENLVLELLPVLDNLDRALEAEGDIREGVRATRDQLSDVLGRAGLLPVASDGQHFDPNVHEAVMGQHSDEHEEGTILQTFERGYLLNGKPIRPAKVVVARQV